MRHLLTALHSFNQKSMVPQKSQSHVFVCVFDQFIQEILEAGIEL